MEEKKVVLAPQDHIELYEDTARRFLREVLDMDADECLITDESRLSDFSTCGMPDGASEMAEGLMELSVAWDIWILGELKSRYGLTYSTTAVPLLALFRDIEEIWTRRKH